MFFMVFFEKMSAFAFTPRGAAILQAPPYHTPTGQTDSQSYPLIKNHHSRRFTERLAKHGAKSWGVKSATLSISEQTMKMKIY
jgi:hypothetical protein